ncbi:hypothetical protein FQN53_004623 [Emmonsiellopsis sp. PD_33]|nr:hypothetical protein FQN53_004623 [Emmonsiellopsis sp. PD_33]
MLRLRPTTIKLSETLALASVQRIMIDRLVHVSGLSNRQYEEPSAESSVFSCGSEYFIPESSLEDFADDELDDHDISPAASIKREDSSPEPPMAHLVPDRSDSPPSDIDNRLANQLGAVRLNFTSSFSSSTWLGPFSSASDPIDENLHPLSRAFQKGKPTAPSFHKTSSCLKDSDCLSWFYTPESLLDSLPSSAAPEKGLTCFRTQCQTLAGSYCSFCRTATSSISQNTDSDSEDEDGIPRTNLDLSIRVMTVSLPYYHQLSHARTRLPNDPEGREPAIPAIPASNPAITPPSICGFTAINTHVPQTQQLSGGNASPLSKSPSPVKSGSPEATPFPSPPPSRDYTRPIESQTVTPGETPRDASSTTQDANRPSKLRTEINTQTAVKRFLPPKTAPSRALDKSWQAPSHRSSESGMSGPLYYCQLPYNYHGSNVYAMSPTLAWHIGESVRIVGHEQFGLPIGYPDPEYILVAPVMNISLVELVAMTCPAILGRLERLHPSIETPDHLQQMPPPSQVITDSQHSKRISRSRKKNMPRNPQNASLHAPLLRRLCAPAFQQQRAPRPPFPTRMNRLSEDGIPYGFPGGRQAAPTLPQLPTGGSSYYQNSHHSYHPYQNHQAHEASQPHIDSRLQVLGNIPANHNNINQTNHPMFPVDRTLLSFPTQINPPQYLASEEDGQPPHWYRHQNYQQLPRQHPFPPYSQQLEQLQQPQQQQQRLDLQQEEPWNRQQLQQPHQETPVYGGLSQEYHPQYHPRPYHEQQQIPQPSRIDYGPVRLTDYQQPVNNPCIRPGVELNGLARPRTQGVVPNPYPHSSHNGPNPRGFPNAQYSRGREGDFPN